MADEVEARSKELRKKTKGKAGDTAFLFTLQQLIDKVDGEDLDVIQKEDFVRHLPMMDTNYSLRSAQKLNNSFGLDSKLLHVCNVCGLDYSSNFRTTSEFFGPSID